MFARQRNPWRGEKTTPPHNESSHSRYTRGDTRAHAEHLLREIRREYRRFHRRSRGTLIDLRAQAGREKHGSVNVIESLYLGACQLPQSSVHTRAYSNSDVRIKSQSLETIKGWRGGSSRFESSLSSGRNNETPDEKGSSLVLSYKSYSLFYPSQFRKIPNLSALRCGVK